MHALKHLHFIVDHLLVTSDILLEYYLYGAFPPGAVRFPHNSICTSAECLAEAVVRPVELLVRKDIPRIERDKFATDFLS